MIMAESAESLHEWDVTIAEAKLLTTRNPREISPCPR